MNYIIATSRVWNEQMAFNLTMETGHKFHLISSKEELSIEKIMEISPRYIFFPHWSYLIPENIYSAYECVVFHMTDLPYGRGGSPLQNLILRHQTETKMTALRCINEIDAGPVYLKRPLNLNGTAQDIFLRAAVLIQSMIQELIVTEPEPLPQQGSVVVFNRKKPEESNLLFSNIANLNDLYDFIRMLDADGYPNAFFDLGGLRFKFHGGKLVENKLVGTFVVSSIEKKENEK